MARNLFSENPVSIRAELLSPPPTVANSMRHRLADIDSRSISDLQALDSLETDTHIKANVFHDSEFDISLRLISSNPDQQFFRGHVDKTDDSTVLLTRVKNRISMTLSVDGLAFSVRPFNNSVHIIEEIDTSIVAEDDVHIETVSPNESDLDNVDGLNFNNNEASIKILVLYTQGVRDKAGGNEQIEDTIRHWVNMLDTALQDSDTNASASLVGVKLYPNVLNLGYCETLDLMRKDKKIRDWRVEAGADLVSIIRSQPGRSCSDCIGGISGNYLQAFSVVNYDLAVNQYSFLHEIGHNLGCTHDPGHLKDQCKGAEDTARGHIFYAGGKWRGTLMAYQFPRVLLYSNPSQNYMGQPTGNAARNNAGTIRKTARRVAHYAEAVRITMVD